jgi:steroid delta-isomerase-like uncharacterized protein
MADDAAIRFLDAINVAIAGDAASLRHTTAPDFVFEEAAGPGERSMAALLAELEMVSRAFPDIAFRPVRHSRHDDRTILEFRAIGTHRGDFLGVPATGTLAIVSGVFTLQIEDDLVRRLRLTVDFGGLRRQLLLAARTA